MDIKKLKGFTLAEVLITLGIIGVVAAITIPPLLQKGDDVATINSVKKEYSVIQNAIKSAEADDGRICQWSDSETKSEQLAAVNQVLSKHLKLTKNCGTAAGCLPPEGYRLFLTDAANLNFDTNDYSKMVLANGTLLWFTVDAFEIFDPEGDPEDPPTYSSPFGKVIFYIDINGQKGPNRFGYDAFKFSVISLPFDNKTSSEAMNQTLLPGDSNGMIGPPGDCNGNFSPPEHDPMPQDGLNCSVWIINKGTVDYKYREMTWNDW